MSNQTQPDFLRPMRSTEKDMPNNIVLNIEPAAASDVRAMNEHERSRKPDGTSAIDPVRRHLNEVLVGNPAGPQAALKDFYDGGVGRPARQAEKPYLRIVLSASAAYFRPDSPEAVGTWHDGRMRKWVRRSLAWLRRETGRDLVHVALHLDEDTPHLHALVAPTYEKRPRKPGKRAKGETEEDFAVRCAAAEASTGVRTVGRASHVMWRQKNSFEALRRRYASAMARFGLHYGEDRSPNAPRGISGREHVRRQTVELRQERGALERDRKEIEKQRQETLEREERLTAAAHHLEAVQMTQKQRAAQLKGKEAELEQVIQRQRAAARTLLQRREALDARRLRLEDILARMADHLGVSNDIQEIEDRLRELDQHVLEEHVASREKPEDDVGLSF